jgi:4-hydroxybenzoate polyprenyltransferase
MGNILKLLRYPNLILIVLTQYLFRYFILFPIFKNEGITPVLSHIDFALLVLSTILIAAAGYAINDYFDIRIDRINKPDKIIVGRLVSRRKAMSLHTVLNIIAIIIGFYVSYRAGNIKFGAINIVISMLLWMYAMKYKAYMLVGNIIVSFATAMTIFIVWLFENYAIWCSGQFVHANLHILNFLLWSYLIFAFGISIIREIIKNLEDIEGDRKCGCTTMPVVIGERSTRITLALLSVVLITALLYISYYFAFAMHWIYISCYLVIVVIIPFIYLIYMIMISRNKDDYSFLSNLTKFIMVAGVLSMLLISYRL